MLSCKNQTKRMQINEGIMKEITGGDDLQGRALWKETITFKPQFTLAVCTNTLFDIKSNDDGTWRRIRVSNESKFLSKPYKNEKKFQENCIHFNIKKTLVLIKNLKNGHQYLCRCWWILCLKQKVR